MYSKRIRKKAEWVECIIYVRFEASSMRNQTTIRDRKSLSNVSIFISQRELRVTVNGNEKERKKNRGNYVT